MTFKSSPQRCENEISINSSLWLAVHLFPSIIYFRHSIHQAIVDDCSRKLTYINKIPDKEKSNSVVCSVAGNFLRLRRDFFFFFFNQNHKWLSFANTAVIMITGCHYHLLFFINPWRCFNLQLQLTFVSLFCHSYCHDFLPLRQLRQSIQTVNR